MASNTRPYGKISIPSSRHRCHTEDILLSRRPGVELETVDDPENHIAIDFDHWQCTKCHEGYPALEEYKECMKNQEGQICRVGTWK